MVRILVFSCLYVNKQVQGVGAPLENEPKRRNAPLENEPTEADVEVCPCSCGVCLTCYTKPGPTI